MSVHLITIENGVKMMRPVVSGEQYRLLRGSARQRAVVKAVREGDGTLRVWVNRGYIAFDEVSGEILQDGGLFEKISGLNGWRL